MAVSSITQSDMTSSDFFAIEETTIAEINRAFDAGTLTSEQLVQLYLDRIAAYDQQDLVLNSIITLNPDALEIAVALDRERQQQGPRSPLHGIPVLIKDNIDTADLPTSAGALVLENSLPSDDAFVVQQLREAGAIILGKTNLDEFARGVQGVSSLGGQTLNPYDFDRTPGGSSAGTAVAITANFAVLGLGTETGVSIRNPAANNSLVGIAPTAGLVSRDGTVPISFTQDRVGPIARTVSDAAIALEIIAGFSESDPSTVASVGNIPEAGYTSLLSTQALEGARIGILRDLFRTGESHEESIAIIEQAIDDLEVEGAIIVDDVSLGFDLFDFLDDARLNLYENKFALNDYLGSLGFNAPVNTLQDILEDGRLLPRTNLILSFSQGIDSPENNPEYLERLSRREFLQDATVNLLEELNLDALVYPMKTLPAPFIGELSPESDNPFTSISGLPGIVVPAGFTSDGLPVGLEISGEPFSEALLLGFAYDYEQATLHRTAPTNVPALITEIETMLQVSLFTGPSYLIEDEGSVSAHVFNVTNGVIPEGGLVVSVNAPNLSEFDLTGVSVEGGEIVAVRDGGFDLRMTEYTTLVNLPITDDGETEVGETASFSLAAGDGYEIIADYSGGTFNLVDTRSDIPRGVVTEPNDIVSAVVTDTQITPENPSFSGADDNYFNIGNRYLGADGTYTYIDYHEDVDLYKVDLSAGDTVAIETFEISSSNTRFGNLTALALFDDEGNRLTNTGFNTPAAPDKLFSSFGPYNPDGTVNENQSDGYLEFTVSEDGTYYVGVSSYVSAGLDFFGENYGYSIETPGLGEDSAIVLGSYGIEIDLLTEDNPRKTGTPTPPVSNPDITNPPTLSLSASPSTIDSDGNFSDNVVEFVELGGISGVNFTIRAEGEIPEEGIEFVLNSDANLFDYVSFLGQTALPSTVGGQSLGAYYNEDGIPTGIRLLIQEPTMTVNYESANRNPSRANFFGAAPLLDIFEPLETDGAEEVTFFLSSGEGYEIDASAGTTEVTYYDSLADVPTSTGGNGNIPEVSITASETTLIESEGTQTTLTFTLSEAPPEEGLTVLLDSEDDPVIGSPLSQFDVLEAEISGGDFPVPNSDSSGFFFNITEQTASITVSVFDELTVIDNPLTVQEGKLALNFGLQPLDGYTINSDASEVNLTILDNPDSQIQVSLAASTQDNPGSTTLIESEGTVSVHTFSLSAPPPEEGLTVQVSTSSLDNFATDAIALTGANISELREDGFSLTITEQVATVALPVIDDGIVETGEIATFTLEPNDSYEINQAATSASFALVDTPDQVAGVAEEIEGNNTLSDANTLALSPQNPTVSINGALFSYAARFPGLAFGYSEDVDFYSVSLEAWQTIAIDIDGDVDIAQNLSTIALSLEDIPQKTDSELRLFDAEGNELAANNDGAAPGEEFSRDPYLEFTAAEAGTYYIGVSQLGNRNYDPNVEASGSGWIFPEVGVFFGDYELTATLEDAPTEPVVSFNIEPDVVSEEGEPASLTGTFTVDGEIPTPEFDAEGNLVSGGLSILFDNTPSAIFAETEGIPIFDGFILGDYFDPETNRLEFILLENTSTFTLNILNDIIQEEDESFTFTVFNDDARVLGSNYVVNPEASSDTVTLTDGVPPEIGPNVGISVSQTELTEGDQLTVNFDVDGDIPAEGLQVLVQSPTVGALGEFAIFDENGNFAIESQGIAGDPEAYDGQGSSFLVTLTEPDASLTLNVFEDGPGEGTESLDFNLVDGEAYEVNGDASSVSLSISEIPEISFSVNTTTLSEEEATLFTFSFSVNGEIPEGGLEVALGGDLLPLIEQLDFSNFDFTNPDNVKGLEIGQFREDGSISLTLLETSGFVSVRVFDDIVQEADANFDLMLLDGDGYSVNQEAKGATVTVTDGAIVGTPPVVSLSLSDTNLSEGEEFTVNFNVDGDVSAEQPLTVLVSSTEAGALGEFEIFNSDGTPAFTTTGISGVPTVGDDTGSSFLVELTDTEASITLPVFNDGIGEGTETFNFTVVDGERYDVDATNPLVALTIEETATFTADENGEVTAFAYDLSNVDAMEVLATVTQEALDITDADFDNYVGFYEVVDSNGGVLDSNGNVVNPGDTGYAKAALENAIDGIALRLGGDSSDDTTAGSFGDAVIQGGKFYAPFAIANAGDMTVAEFLAANPDNMAATEVEDQVAYFAYLGANPDGANHLKSWGDGIFGFEDLPDNLGVSDNDFNDAVFKFNFNAIG